MDKNNNETDFAPPERATGQVIMRQSELFKKDTVYKKIFDTVPDVILLLNSKRQIVHFNDSMLTFSGFSSPESLLGLRPGEALNCIYSKIKSGCGTTKFCSTCGAVRAILSSLEGKTDVQECSVIRHGDEMALDLRVWTAPLTFEDENFSIFIIADIRHEKRRRVLEKIFFHDILNTVGGLRGMTELMCDLPLDELHKFLPTIKSISNLLIDEIMAQKELSSAENNEMIVEKSMFSSINILNDTLFVYKSHKVSKDKQVIIDSSSEDVVINSDRNLIIRVIGNMVKNGLEASSPGDNISIGCKQEEGRIRFWVHNSGYIPKKAQLQIFKRSFSTKGSGRGLGTYSMKLLSEKYLKGEVSYKTSKEHGTTFYAIYPIQLN